MTMMSIGTGLAVGAGGAAASWGIGQFNKSKAPNWGAGIQIGVNAQNALNTLAGQYNTAVNTAGTQAVNALSNYSGNYTKNFQGNSQNYLSPALGSLNQYGSLMSGLSSSAVPSEFNAAQSGLGFNASNLGNYGALSSALSNQAQGVQMGLINNSMPGWQQSYNQGMENAGQMQQGLIASDVQGSVGRTAGFNALQSGVGGGSGLGRNLTARDLGLTSMQLQQQGTAQAQALGNQQYGMTVANMMTNPGAIMSSSGVNSSQAMNAGALGLNLAETGYNTGLQGTLNTLGTNFNALNADYSNIYGQQASLNLAQMQAADQAESNAFGVQASGINGNYQNQMSMWANQNAWNRAQSNYNNQLGQGALGGITSALGTGFMGAYNSGALSNFGIAPSSYSNQFGLDGMSSQGFAENLATAQSLYGPGANLTFQPGSGWYNQGYK